MFTELLSPSSLGYHAVIGAIFLLSAFLQGITGFGFGMVAMSLLPFVMGARLASIVGAFLALANTGYLAWRLRRSAERRVLLHLFLGALAGVPVGVTALNALSDSLLKRLIGLSVFSYALYHAWRAFVARRSRKSLAAWWRFPVGVLAGAIGGATNVGGPPIIFYVYRQPWSPEVIQATLVTYFALISALKVVLLFVGGMVSPSMVVYGLALPMIWIGSTCGLWVSRRMRPAHFQTVVVATLALFGLLLLLRG